MARPKVPLIDRDDAIAAARDLIERDGLQAFSIRKLADELGVSGAALYHHFRDKQAILDGVRVSIVLDSAVALDDDPGATWVDQLRSVVEAYRSLLVRHPQMAPLMHPSAMDRFGFVLRERVAATLLAGGVPRELIHPIMDSVELLAFASASLNPEQHPPSKRMTLTEADGAPVLLDAVAAAPASAQTMFDQQLDALLRGWEARVDRG